MTMNARDEGLMSAIAVVLLDEVEKAIKPLRERIAKLEDRGWKGDFQKALSYSAQSEVRHKGASWVATRDIAPGEVPGEGCTGWQLKDKAQTPPRGPTAQRM